MFKRTSLPSACPLVEISSDGFCSVGMLDRGHRDVRCLQLVASTFYFEEKRTYLCLNLHELTLCLLPVRSMTSRI
jgi:hypothetical protein